MNKIVMTLSILIGVSLMFGVSMVLATHDNCKLHDEWVTNYHYNIFCYIVEIYDQNERIIDKLDWDYCVSLTKETYGYNHNTSGLTITDIDIVNMCGERP